MDLYLVNRWIRKSVKGLKNNFPLKKIKRLEGICLFLSICILNRSELDASVHFILYRTKKRLCFSTKAWKNLRWILYYFWVVICVLWGNLSSGNFLHKDIFLIKLSYNRYNLYSNMHLVSLNFFLSLS